MELTANLKGSGGWKASTVMNTMRRGCQCGSIHMRGLVMRPDIHPETGTCPEDYTIFSVSGNIIEMVPAHRVKLQSTLN